MRTNAFLALIAIFSSQANGELLYNNAVPAGLVAEGLRTSARPNGGDYSEVQNGNIGAGATFRMTAGRVADDFVVFGASWNIREVIVWGYQTGATNIWPISGQMEIRIGSYDGPTVAIGALVQDQFTNIYRVFNMQFDDTRRVQKLKYEFNCLLKPGQYWIVFFGSGDVSLTGPWCPSLTKAGGLTTPGANAMLQSYALYVHWEQFLDPGSLLPQDIPFWINGYRLPVRVNPGDQQIQGPIVPPPTLFQRAFGPLMETQ